MTRHLPKIEELKTQFNQIADFAYELQKEGVTDLTINISISTGLVKFGGSKAGVQKLDITPLSWRKAKRARA